MIATLDLKIKCPYCWVEIVFPVEVDYITLGKGSATAGLQERHIEVEHVCGGE